MKPHRQFDPATALKTSLPRKLVLVSVTAGGIGYVPLFPGTVGTLAAIPFSFGLNRLADTSLWLASITLVVAILYAIALATTAGDLFRQKDPGAIVIDEIVGFLTANFAAPASVTFLIAAFFVFRFFDIAKIFPADQLERLPGGAGIVLDDIMAGIYTFAVMRLLLAWGIV
jgi:phosphatidylglycerophosphatase A